jgi:uncharacterized protein
MTAGVYGIVAGIVKLDNAGLHLSRKPGVHIWGKLQRRAGDLLLHLSPYLMKGLSIVGTIAMFIVGGGILAHGIPGAHEWIERAARGAGSTPAVGRLLATILPSALDIAIGIFAGGLVLCAVSAAGKLRRLITVGR